MALTDLFNPSFFMFLGILVLAVALLVVYFESKFREQNHKIASMLSLVSSLAEEVNGTKMIIHQLTANPQMQQQAPFFYQNKEPALESKIIKNNDSLIAVSDDESDSESECDSDAESEESIDEESEESDSESDSDSQEEQNNTIKIFKLNISGNDEESQLDEDAASLEEIDEDDDLEEFDDNSSTTSDSDKEPELNDDKTRNNFMDLKSINITLEETKTEESIDYRKMSLPKLRSAVAEKGLSTDSSKLKKNELLKLLGVE
jgi:hypothetical protein